MRLPLLGSKKWNPVGSTDNGAFRPARAVVRSSTRAQNAGASDVSGVWPGRRVWVANEICPLTATDLPAVVTTGRG